MRNCFVIILFFLFLLSPKAVIPLASKDITRVNQPLSQGVFLVATHDLGGSFFSNSVILLAKYSHKGALGVIINRPSGISLSEVLPEFKELKKDLGTLFIGGPVARFSPVLLLRTDRETKNAHRIFGNTSYSTDIRSVMDFVINKNSKDRMRVYAGYAGWHAGQLESEVARGSWRVVMADQYTIFDKDSDTIWDDLMRGDTPLFIKNPGKKILRVQQSKQKL
jgi:putative transcriptional regulator|tara:strand:- start:12774 stop:13439 length:666 start_codon:yes stop_codon:yes gene_type:complete